MTLCIGKWCEDYHTKSKV